MATVLNEVGHTLSSFPVSLMELRVFLTWDAHTLGPYFKKQDARTHVFIQRELISPCDHTAALFPPLLHYLYLLKDCVVKIFQTLNLRCFCVSSGGPLGVSGDGVSASARGQRRQPALDCFGQHLSGFLELFTADQLNAVSSAANPEVTSPVRTRMESFPAEPGPPGEF
ncbi:hypothetical protein Q8A73_022811 [Channa argus]|nr:hypothetical protein Q8A73_022811 [Channa argus]